MSVTRSSSTDSLSSSNTTAITQLNEQQIDPSNILYNDRQNYQIIFTNDSRFFDTSLHLFKSYCGLGYIQVDNKKLRKNLFSSSTNTLKPLPNGANTRSRPQSSGFSSNHDVRRNSNGTLKPPFLRNYDHSMSQRSEPSPSKFSTPKIKHGKSPLVVSDQRQPVPYNQPITNDDSSDEADVIVTRL